MGQLGTKQVGLIIKMNHTSYSRLAHQNNIMTMVVNNSRLSQYRVKVFFLLCVFYLCGQALNAQNCTSLYLIISGLNGSVYTIDVSTGSKTLVTTLPNSKENLAVGPDPTSTGTTVFTSSKKGSGSAVYKTSTSIGTTLPKEVKGLTANPATTGATAGYVYGISKDRELIQASPAPAANLGTITGDATWSSATISGDAFFDYTGSLYTIIVNGSSKYLYKINITTLVATQQVQLSGSLPANFDGIAYFNSKIYAAEGNGKNVQLYEINANTGQGTTGVTISWSTDVKEIDLASCDYLTPATPAGSPTCNELFGVEWKTHRIYRIDPTSLATTLISTGTQIDQGNMSYGPVTTNLNQNQFVTSPNSALGTIYKDLNNTGTLTSTGNTIGSPIGLGTDPATGIVWGLNDVTLTKWTGSGNGTTVGTITGDAIWTSGTSLNDIAVDAASNLYSIVFHGSSTYLYRINPTTLVAKKVVQATGAFITDGTTTNGNGMAYQGDYFYYSRLISGNTDVWALNAVTGVSVYVGSVSGIEVADLGSCATVTNVPADFTFNCGAVGAGLQNGTLLATGGTQTNTLRVSIINTVTGLATFTVTGTGITSSPTAYTVTVPQGATYVDVPITYDGSGVGGTRTLTVTVTDAIYSGTCAINITVGTCTAGSVKPTLSATTKSNTCPATTVDLSTLTASNNPGGSVLLTWHSDIPATTANKLSSITALPEGTYYAAFYDPISDCYSGANGGATTLVTAKIAFCCNASTTTPPLNKN